MSESSRSTNNTDPNALLTPKSLALALSPPRAPPYGSWHRDILLTGHNRHHKNIKNNHTNKKHHQGRIRQWLSPLKWARHYHVTEERVPDQDGPQTNNDEPQPTSPHIEARSRVPHDTLRQRLLQRLLQSHSAARSSQSWRHPHLTVVPDRGDQVTRWLGVWLPLSWQRSFRDSGWFRTVCDVLVTTTAPLVPLAAPRAALTFIQHSNRLHHLRYGTHARQYLHLILPSTSSSDKSRSPRRILVFVHGGAWGSGMPWMYRLVAHEQFLAQNWAVAIVGYRTYPDGHVQEQVDDVAAACAYLQQHFMGVDNNKPIPMTLMGHSSGAHIGLLLLVNHVIDTHLSPESSSSSSWNHTAADSSSLSSLSWWNALDSFVGLSGPYDICHHFDYEAARGVEEISPMKPTCGSTRTAFRHWSPARKLQAALATATTTNKSLANPCMLQQLLPPLLLLHSVDDETVPFTSTSEAAHVLHSCGITKLDQVYVADSIAHQDTVMHLMLGGRVLDETLAWIQRVQHEKEQEQERHRHQQQQEPKQQPSSSSSNRTKLLVQSKL